MRLPDVEAQSESLINTAIDVVSAAFMYIAVHIRHEATVLGLIGRQIPFQYSLTLYQGGSEKLLP
jgi:hypothetical protein